jgi:alpha-aminoadipic semialdehyde synthase
MPGSIGVRREDRSRWERRVPVTPEVAAELRAQHGVSVVVQPSSIRAFADEEFSAAGAIVQDSLTSCPIVFAVKEIPVDRFEPGQAYMFFAHVIKGQPFNMPMLRRMLDLGCTLIDYEKVADDKGRRLIFFGWHAGVAGMVETLWALGKRLAWEGIDTPFARLGHPHEYRDLDEIKAAVAQAADSIRLEGLPEALVPLTIGVAGYGNVARGVWEILDLLPMQHVEPGELAALSRDPSASRHLVYATTFREEHLATPRVVGETFNLQRYYSQPEAFEPAFEAHLPHLDVLVNAIYWDPRYPRLVTKRYLRERQASRALRLRVIGDISCDIDGAIECTVRATEPDEPVFVFDPATEQAVDGYEGDGVVVMAVDILPSELPRDASNDFSRVLQPYLPALAVADYTASLDALDLPPEIKRAVIVHRGELAPAYRYLQLHLASDEAC